MEIFITGFLFLHCFKANGSPMAGGCLASAETIERRRVECMGAFRIGGPVTCRGDDISSGDEQVVSFFKLTMD
jgi:hypothetical protein